MTDRDAAADHMHAFAERTGLTADRPPDRYLWTDAFAVCNFLGLARETDRRARYLELARRLVDQVHHTLGRFRDDDDREGWLSGLSGREAEAHPTRGGLRIGKPLPERDPGEPMDRRQEWDRDGQYFHYNTKWMVALDFLARATGKAKYNRWARELAEASYEGFTYRIDGPTAPRMYWKVRVDLSGPLVDSMGQHDPLDGYGTYRQLAATAEEMGADGGPGLDDAIASFATMLAGQRLTTTDPLGLGGLLIAADREARLLATADEPDPTVLGDILAAADDGLDRDNPDSELDRPAARRLAFRELGLAIGLHGVEQLRTAADDTPRLFPVDSVRRRHLDALTNYLDVRGRIVSYWQRSDPRNTETWTGHQNINQVMLATALAPSGCLIPPEV
ncbi:MAG: hypothetical protein ABEN55_19550 [Bradymonadaceae bacterium]